MGVEVMPPTRIYAWDTNYSGTMPELQYLQTVVVIKLAVLNYNICAVCQLRQMQVMTLANHITCEL